MLVPNFRVGVYLKAINFTYSLGTRMGITSHWSLCKTKRTITVQYTLYLTKYEDPSPEGPSCSHKIPNPFCNPMNHNNVHHNPPLNLIPRDMNLVQPFQPTYIKLILIFSL